MALNLITKHLMLVFGVVRPGVRTYMDFNRDGPEQCTGWFKYWIVYAFVTSILPVADLLFFWLPWYEVAKLITILILTIGAPRNGIRIYDFLDAHKDIFNKYAFITLNINGFFTNELCLHEEGKEYTDKEKDKAKDKFYFKKIHNGADVIFIIRGTKNYIRSQNWKLKKIPAATESEKPIISENEVESGKPIISENEVELEYHEIATQ